MKHRQSNASIFLRRVVPQVVIQCILIVATTVLSYILMTLIIVNLAEVESVFYQTLFEILGTMVLMITTLVSLNTYVYQKRIREIEILTKAISKVAGGQYEYRIDTKKPEPMTPVYEDFNKMCAELSSVKILQNDFINNYSHEFKTPIASINGFASLLLEKGISENDKREYLEIIRDESDRLTTLAKNTILLSKLSSQQIVTEQEDYHLDEQLRQCSIICSRLWTEKKQEFIADFNEVTINANKELLQHLWINLINNAIKYTPEGGEITVTLTKDDENAIVTVSDTGEGMSEETMKNLFKPYYQGDSSRSTQGLGLGLSIVNRIVELSEGTIDVESKLQVGSKFTVKLPLGIKQKEPEQSRISVRQQLSQGIEAIKATLNKQENKSEK